MFRVDVAVVKGDYQLCFDNTFSYQASKIIYFQIFIFDQHGSSDDLDYSKLTGISVADDALKRIMQEIGITADAFKVIIVVCLQFISSKTKYNSKIKLTKEE